MIKAAVVGASGYTGIELIRIIQKHGKAEVASAISRTHTGKKISSLYPEYKGKLVYSNLSIDDINKALFDVVFLCTPNGEAMKIVPRLDERIKIIDLSADYRFSSHELFEKVYRISHADKDRKAIYGLPEMNREEIRKARLVANPGCYVTSSILAGLPLGGYASHIIFDCASGWSGAGKSSRYSIDNDTIKDNYVAYKLTDHRHGYEIAQALESKVSFTPHVLDTYRGIMCTAHVLLNGRSGMDRAGLIKMYKDRYKGEPFVEISDSIPELRDAINTNRCVIGGFEIDDNGRAVIVSVLDNLFKGASGQAVQNMNIMFGISEKEGFE